ncbi:type VI secretion system baseplate subunit TssG [Spirosoma migulaei]
MEPSADYAERLNHLPVDLRAEVVLAEMLDDGVSLDDVIINPVGAFNRAFGRDISRTEWIEAQHQSKRWLQIDLNRTGLYDLLPEGVFHQPTANDASSTKESVLREMAIQRQREQAARRFFLPIEQEFFRQRVRIEQGQQAFLSDADASLTDNPLGWFWNLPDFLTPTQTKRLLYLLPIVSQLAGDLIAMKACFEQLVEERVSLQVDSPGMVFLQTDTPALGQWELGTDSVFNGWLHSEEPIVRITIHIDHSDQVTSYLPGQNGRRLLEWLAGYLVPLDTDWRIELDTSQLKDSFLFASDESIGRLDFTTYV